MQARPNFYSTWWTRLRTRLGPAPIFTVLGGPASLQDAVFTVLVVLLHSVAYVRALLAILFDLNELLKRFLFTCVPALASSLQEHG